MREYRKGTLTPLPQPSLIERLWAKIDKRGPIPEHAPHLGRCWVWTGGKTEAGPDAYGQVWVDGGMRLVHKLLWELRNGPVPDGLMLDHVCHTKLCVRPSHLRTLTNKQNRENRTHTQANNTSGEPGVTQDKRTGKWVARVRTNGRTHYAGRHTTKQDAIDAVREKRRQLFTHNDLDRIPNV